MRLRALDNFLLELVGFEGQLDQLELLECELAHEWILGHLLQLRERAEDAVRVAPGPA